MLPSRACWLAKASDKPKEATASGGGEGAGEQVGAGDSDKRAGVHHRQHEIGVEVVRDGAYKGAASRSVCFQHRAWALWLRSAAVDPEDSEVECNVAEGDATRPPEECAKSVPRQLDSVARRQVKPRARKVVPCPECKQAPKRHPSKREERTQRLRRQALVTA